MRILVIDDDQNILSLMELALPALGFPKFDLAESAEEAMEAIEFSEKPFDCILLDIQMPGMDGIELCARLRQMPAYRTVPIFMITAMSGRSFIEAAFRAGANDYFVKPFDMDDLKARLTLVEDAVKRRVSLPPAPEEAAQVQSNPATQLGDPLFFADVPGMLEPASLENYVTQLGHFDRLNATAFGLTLVNAADLHGGLSDSAYLKVIRELSGVIDTAMRNTSMVFSYYGDGIFCIVSDNSILKHREAMLGRFKSLLEESVITAPGGTPLALQIDLGRVFRMRTNAGESAAALVQAALKDARTRQMG